MGPARVCWTVATAKACWFEADDQAAEPAEPAESWIANSMAADAELGAEAEAATEAEAEAEPGAEAATEM